MLLGGCCSPGACSVPPPGPSSQGSKGKKTIYRRLSYTVSALHSAHCTQGRIGCISNRGRVVARGATQCGSWLAVKPCWATHTFAAMHFVSKSLQCNACPPALQCIKVVCSALLQCAAVLFLVLGSCSCSVLVARVLRLANYSRN